VDVTCSECGAALECGECGVLVDHQEIQGRLEEANKDILFVLARVLETRDPYTAGHSFSVAEFAVKLAKNMALSAQEIEHVRVAATLHDIGKHDPIYMGMIGKARRLSRVELGIMRTHASKGAEFLAQLSTFPQEVIDAVHYHHERWDGEGYPEGLAGEEIPLIARIVGICDAIDAMAHDRVYRKARTPAWIRGELKRCAGTQFDPEIVEVALEHL